MRLPNQPNSAQKKQTILNGLQNMDFEDMFSNFASMPKVNFAVSESEISEKLWGDRPTRRTLFKEFNHAAGLEEHSSKFSTNRFTNGP